jgi:hypothetical protein
MTYRHTDQGYTYHVGLTYSEHKIKNQYIYKCNTWVPVKDLSDCSLVLLAAHLRDREGNV